MALRAFRKWKKTTVLQSNCTLSSDCHHGNASTTHLRRAHGKNHVTRENQLTYIKEIRLACLDPMPQGHMSNRDGISDL